MFFSLVYKKHSHAPIQLFKVLPVGMGVDVKEDIEAPRVWFLANGGNRCWSWSPAVRLRCFSCSGTGGGRKGEGTTLTTGGVAAGTAFMSILRPSRITTSSPTLWLWLKPFLCSAIISRLMVEFWHLPSRCFSTLNKFRVCSPNKESFLKAEWSYSLKRIFEYGVTRSVMGSLHLGW